MTYQEKFIAKYAKPLQEAAKRHNFKFPSVPLGQACQETGFGRKSIIYEKAGNPLGIKWDKRITDEYYVEYSAEEENGVDRQVKSKWCVFKTPEEAAEGYFKFLEIHSHYAVAWEKETAEDCIRQIGKTYATRTGYAESVIKLINQYNLKQYDPVVNPTPKEENIPVEKVIYHVQAGAFQSKSNAEDLVKKLKAAGFPAMIYYSDKLFKVQVGAYEVKSNADKMCMKLKDKKFNCFIWK